MMATNLHADTYDQARAQICAKNHVQDAAFRRMNLIYFLALEKTAQGIRRRISHIWESNGRDAHRLLFDESATDDWPRNSQLVTPEAFQEAGRVLDSLLKAGARTIEDVRQALCPEG